MLADLGRLAARPGGLPPPGELVRLHRELVTELEVYFESLEAACRLVTASPPAAPTTAARPTARAQVNPVRARVPWTRPAVVEALRARFRAGRLYHGGEPGLVRAAEQLFGSYARAIETISTSTSGREPITAADVLAVVRRLADERPGLTAAQFERTAFAPAVRKHFGGLEAAAGAAGLAGWPLRAQPRVPR